jgi:hypothetical protein
MRLGHRLAAAGVAALLLLTVGAPAAFAYEGQVTHQITVAGPAGTLLCKTSLTVTATVLDALGNPVDNRAVVWTFGAGMVTGDQVVTVSTMTNATGVATTTVKLACVVGNRTIIATSEPSTGQVVLGITAIGLPPTGTTPPETTPLWAYAMAVLAICGASFLVGRRVLQGR